MTPSERLVWERVRSRRFRGLKFYRQRPYGRFVLDFYCPELRLAIEIDGGAHDHPDAGAADAQRETILEAAGIRFVRLAVAEVERDPDGALEQALAAFLANGL